MLKLAVVAALAGSLGGCIATNLERYNRIDLTQRTVAIPPDNSPLIAGIRGALAGDGWTLVDPVWQPGTVPARYYLDIRLIWVEPETCDPLGGRIVRFDLILYDNETRDAALVFRGRDCSHDAVATFMAAARRYVKFPPPNLADASS